MPGDKNKPIGIKTPFELGGTKIAGNGGDKTQLVALHLINRLPKPSPGYNYCVFLDNLFVSIQMVEYTRSIGIAVTGIYKDTGGVIQKLLDLKKKDKKNILPWGTTYSFPTASGKVYYIGWKD
jgi:hypothetical protein